MATILLVCTGNICRSPMAEGFLRQMLAGRSIEGVDVESAGVSGLDGYPAMPEAVTALIERDIDISSHLARRLSRNMAESADLVVGMSSGHRDAMVRLAPKSADRTFTLKELVHLLGQQDQSPSQGGPAERMAVAISAAQARRGSGGTDDLTDEDITDPMGLGPEAFRAVAWQIEALTDGLVEGLFGPDLGEGLRSEPSEVARADEGGGLR